MIEILSRWIQMNNEKNLQKLDDVAVLAADTNDSKEGEKQPDPQDARKKLLLDKEAKLAEALRANLRKRKEQKKQRKDDTA